MSQPSQPMPDSGLRTDLSPERAANLAENPHAGQGAVMLDIGGDIGAVIVHLPASLEGAEIEVAPVSSWGADRHDDDSAHEHGHEDSGHAHDSGHGHEEHGHGHGHGHSHGTPHLPHVAVVGRPTPTGETLYSAVFPSLTEGAYVLHDPTTGDTRTVEVVGGFVAEVDWADG